MHQVETHKWGSGYRDHSEVYRDDRVWASTPRPQNESIRSGDRNRSRNSNRNSTSNSRSKGKRLRARVTVVAFGLGLKLTDMQ